MGHPLGAVIVTLFLTLRAGQALGQAPSQAFFLSIDCGATEAYVDPVTGINWVPDGNYTAVGTNVAAVPSAPALASNAEASTLRYFSEPRKKYCYELPVQSNQTYGIAATFWYGNYDGLSNPPTFSMAIDATEVAGVDLTDGVYQSEALRHDFLRQVAVGQTTMAVCLYPDPKSSTRPIISSLELRLMPVNAYVRVPWLEAGNFLYSSGRQDFGGVTTTRFPDDPLDRVWRPAADVPATMVVNSSRVVTSEYALKPPSAILQTAITPTTFTDLVIPYQLATATVPLECVYYLYMAELNASASRGSRVFNFNVPGNPDGTSPVDLMVEAEGVDMALIYFWQNVTLTDTSSVTLAPSGNATLPPMVNAAEMLFKFPALVLPTNDDDVSALKVIKAALGLTGWSGDPCLPLPYDWIGCSSAPSPRITTVKLDGYNLTGDIPVAFSLLTALTSLNLSRNALTGSIPSGLSTLPALKELILVNNNLTGTVPPGLVKPGLALDIRGNPVCNCGGVEDAPTPSSSDSKKSSSSIGVIAGVVGGIVAAVVIVGLIVLCVCYKKRKREKDDKLTELPLTYAHFADGGGSAGTAGLADGGVQGARAYSLAEITAATNKFNRKIGEGGFGPVYYGELVGGKKVAVKVSDANSHQGVNEFNNEVQLLSRVHHKNLVSLVGYCLEGKSQMLVYEFVPRGTVREHLYGSPLAIDEPLDWKTRLDIAVNSAQGLEYLHGGCTPSIIHRDVKSSNILLTDKYVAKVADFGLSKTGPEEGGASHVSTMVKGTAGYLDPEYWSTNNLTEKSDVFSFGVVLLELLCGRQPIDHMLEERRDCNIVDKVRRSLQAGDIDSILDPAVQRCHPNLDSVWKVAEVAIQSVEPKGAHRPTMREVVKEIREAITLEMGNSQPFTDHSAFSRASQPAPAHMDYSNSGSISDVSTNFEQFQQGPHVR